MEDKPDDDDRARALVAAEGFGEPAAVGFPERGRRDALRPLSTEPVDVRMSTPLAANAPSRRRRTRRGQNEGTIFRRPDGRWCAGLNLGGGQRKFWYGRTREEVSAKLTAALRDYAFGVPPPDARITVEEFLTRWLEEVVRPRLRIWTYRGYEVHVRRHILPHLGRMRLASVAPGHVQRLINAKLETLSPKTVHYMRQVLRSAFQHALRWGYLQRNVVDLVPGPRKPRIEVQPLSLEEARAFLAGIEGDPRQAFYTVALALGLRQGELLGLRWADVDWSNELLNVRHALQRIDHQFVLTETKTVRSRRSILMPPTVVDALKGRRKQQLEARLAGGRPQPELDLVFTTDEDRPLDARTVTRVFQRKLAKLGIRQLRFHDLRHSCATVLLLQGVSPRVVMETLGHSEIGTTMNTYAHVLPELQR